MPASRRSCSPRVRRTAWPPRSSPRRSRPPSGSAGARCFSRPTRINCRRRSARTCVTRTYVPFSQVLPRCAAIVHHAGIGTSAQALAAGIPQLTMPMGFDQPDNTTRLWRLGAARWVVPNRFNGERVANELAALLDDPRTSERCRHWAEEMRRGDPLLETCAALEALL